MTSLEEETGTSVGPELLIRLQPNDHKGGRREQLEHRLRELIRDGTLAAQTRLPSSRALAGDLGVSRRLVVEAYAQLLAEGYLGSRPGAGTYVTGAATTTQTKHREPRGRPLQFDFFPGAPDLRSFPRTLWLRATREALSRMPAAELAYPDARGMLALRQALSAYLGRARGVVVEPDSIVICSGATQGLALLGRALVRRGIDTIAVEDPSLPAHRAVLAYTGLQVRGTPVDDHGLDVRALGGAPVVLTTPAHQHPTGVVLSPERRTALLEWARAEGVVVEDDYDAEFRYDRTPLGALQGLAPDRIVYLGTVSKTLAPGLRLGWLVVPASLLNGVVEAKIMDDLGSPAIEQLALAHLLETASYDRHLRKMRRQNSRRRDALLAAIGQRLPGARVEGVSAGLHALLRLPAAVDAQRLVAAATRRSVGAYPLSMHMVDPPRDTDAVVLGYACLSEPAIKEGIRRFADAFFETLTEMG